MSNVVSLRPAAPETIHAEPYLVFSNPGILDINLVKLLGVSVQESDSAIGFFGTGLKYAIASTLPQLRLAPLETEEEPRPMEAAGLRRLTAQAAVAVGQGPRW